MSNTQGMAGRGGAAAWATSAWVVGVALAAAMQPAGAGEVGPGAAEIAARAGGAAEVGVAAQVVGAAQARGAPRAAAAAALGPVPMPGSSAAVPIDDIAGTDTRPVAQVIDEYVRESLRSNLSLRSESLEVERNIAALDAARAHFLPTVAFQARYTRAEGGREIDIPVGTLVNPVYSTLNQLLAAQGKPPQFGSVPDQTILFQRKREQDTRFTVRQPLYAPAIPAAVRAQRAQLEASQFNRIAVARRLKRDVTVAYLNWLKARRTVGIVEASVTLLNENVRVNESLFRNGKITQDQVLRARAEQLAVVQQLREAQNGQSQAHSFVNFLLNRPLDEPLEAAGIDGQVGHTAHDLARLRTAALENRPEIAQLDRTVTAAESQIQVARADLKPSLSLGVDAGIQDETYDFGHGSNFGTVSLLLHWQFFDGGATRAQASSARAVARRAATARDEIEQQIQLEVQQALDELNTTADSLTTAGARAEAAHAAFRIASRKRDEGVINQVEFIDARSALTSAELNLNVTRFDLLAREAELDYATAAGTLPFDLGK
jgi:outer membrane protein